jgi:hypothetical protein
MVKTCPKEPQWLKVGTGIESPEVPTGSKKETGTTLYFSSVSNMLDPNIKMKAYHQRDANLPAPNSLTDEQRRWAPTTCKKVPDSVVKDIKLEKKRRNDLDHAEVEFEENTSNDEDDPEEKDEEEEEEEEEYSTYM